jgi:hypothetical protein
MAIELDRAAIRQLTVFLEPLVGLDDDDTVSALLDSMGWDAGAAQVTGATLASASQAARDASDALATVMEADEIALEDVASAVVPVGTAIVAIASAISGLGNLPGSVRDELGKDLVSGLVTRWLATSFPRLCLALDLLGLLRWEECDMLVAGGAQVRAAGRRRTVRFDALGDMLRSPLDYVKSRFTSAAGIEAVADDVGPDLAETLRTARCAAEYGFIPGSVDATLTDAERAAGKHLLVVDVSLPTEDVGVVSRLRFVFGLRGDGSGPTGLLLSASGSANVTLPTGAGTFTAGLTIGTQTLVIASAGIETAEPGNAVTFDVSLGYATPGSPSDPVVRFGSPTGTRFELAKIAVKGGAGMDAAGPDARFSVDLTGLLIALQGGDGDGFLAKVLPKDPITLTADLGMDYGLRSGLTFHGSGGFEKKITIGETLGPIEIQEITVGLRLGDVGVATEVTAGLGVTLGPVAASVEGIGLSVQFKPAPNGQQGNLGSWTAIVGFRPPRGMGLVVDAGPVSGGGYLFFDPEEGKYAGILQLEVQGTISIKVIGLLATKMPDGRDGFSLLLIVCVDFPPIQLGFGFSLNGLGGLAGVNRTMVIPVLQAGIKNGTLGSIMFPDDPIKNAPRIISDLEAVFPVAENRYVFGPMASLGWGSPPILSLELGIVLELPMPIRIVIMGRIKLALPPETDDAILLLQLDVLGAIDLGECKASIDASLYDSRIVMFTITGDMAMRLSWGSRSDFALSCGGFHPKFTPPPDFPHLERLAISLATGDNPRIRLESYLATTTSAFMVGARLEAYAALDTGFLGTFSASATLGFDALVKFSPFSFLIELYGSASIKHDDDVLMGADLYLALSGPEPWHAWGKATIDFFGEHDISFDVTIGDDPHRQLPPPPDPMPELYAALADARNWTAQLPPDGHVLVTLRELDPAGAVLVHPFGQIGVRQRVLPLDVTITRFGALPLAAPLTVTLGASLNGREATSSEPVTDSFAPGQFLDLTEDQKLSRPAFEPFDSGLTGLSISAAAAPAPRSVKFEYETTVVDEPEPPPPANGSSLARLRRPPARAHSAGTYSAAHVLDSLAELAAANEAPLERRRGKAATPPRRMRVRDLEYTVVDRDDLGRAAGTHGSFTQAEQARAAAKGGAPAQVVASYEVVPNV